MNSGGTNYIPTTECGVFADVIYSDENGSPDYYLPGEPGRIQKDQRRK